MGLISSIIASEVLAQATIKIGEEALSKFFTHLVKLASKLVAYYSAEPVNNINRSGNVDGINLKTLIEQARKQHGIESRLYFNFAFAGHVNTGKSSMINAIRGLTDKDPGAASVGETETTQKPIYYKFPYGFRIRLYDIPGSGVIRHRANSYFLDKGLCAFDCLIILVQTAMGEEELEFARAAIKFKVPVCFVCSKSDVYLYNRQQRGDIDEITQDEADRLIQQLRPKFAQEIARVPEIDPSDVPLFFISAPSLRRLIQFMAKPEIGLPNNYIRYEESSFIEYLQKKSAESRYI